MCSVLVCFMFIYVTHLFWEERACAEVCRPRCAAEIGDQLMETSSLHLPQGSKFKLPGLAASTLPTEPSCQPFSLVVIDDMLHLSRVQIDFYLHMKIWLHLCMKYWKWLEQEGTIHFPKCCMRNHAAHYLWQTLTRTQNGKTQDASTSKPQRIGERER